MIKLEKVHKYFYRHKRNQIHVINNTSLELENTGLVALLGPSGCGKTTLLNAIGGLDKVNRGKIFINGKKITRRSSAYVDKIRNLNIGYIFQDYYLVDTLSVYDNVALVLKINGIKNREEIKKRVNYVLEKVGMYRYRNRYASMLSGGERQRVGIARAIVKDPNIIIADEPTGNLDSRNTLQVMNIIKAISKDRLVILVTHETDIAQFYASKIIDIQDGEIKSIRDNDHTNDLDYRLDSKIYLKDMTNHQSIQEDNVHIDFYSNDKTKYDFDIVVQNGNVYIKAKGQDKENIEIVDDDSSIEIVDEHYKKINKTIYEEYDFDFKSISNKTIKKRYTSIFNPITLLINGFKKVRDYSLLKKILLFGFFASGMTIMNVTSNYLGVTDIKDEDFVTNNRNHLSLVSKNIKVSDYLSYENSEYVDYMIPGNSLVSLSLPLNDYYQTYYASTRLNGSLSSINMLNEKDIILGEYPKNNNEIVIDKLIYDGLIESGLIKQAGIINENELLGRKVTVPNMKDFIIVGFVNKRDPSIYVYEEQMINILYNGASGGSDDYVYSKVSEESKKEYIDFRLMQDKITIKKGVWPVNDYEVMINYNLKDEFKINKYIDSKINGTKLKVVGYYTSPTNADYKLVSNNSIKYDLITMSENMTVYSLDKEETIRYFTEEKEMNIEDTYLKSKNAYIKSTKDFTLTAIIMCSVALFISLIEIYLMVRSSFLSRIREVGIYRAIGMKKNDIRKMFVGEIIAITTLSCLPGVILMSYIVKQLKTISFFQNTYYINTKLILLVIAFVYVFNIVIGLLPVNRVIRKTPAQILSRSDI